METLSNLRLQNFMEKFRIGLMMKYFLIINLLFIVFFAKHFFPAYISAADDPASIKFKTFKPTIVTATPTYSVRPTDDPSYSPPPIPPTSTPPPIPPPFGGYYCRTKGLGLYFQQVRFLNSDLCSDGSIAPSYPESFVPANLDNTQSALGTNYWVRDPSTLLKSEIIPALRNFLDYLKTNGCIPQIAYGYRSFAFQKYLWELRGCATNPNCGVAYPGNSAHQSGVTMDIYCSRLNIYNQVEIFPMPARFFTESYNFGLIHPIDWDTGHFLIY